MQASILGLYDTTRYKHPTKNNKKLSWLEIDKEIIAKLELLKNEKADVVFLSPTIYSPSSISVINRFLKKYDNIRWIQYDTQSTNAIAKAQKICFGTQGVPDYVFENADIIVSFDADFLGSWMNSSENIKRYVQKRKLNSDNNHMSQHIQFESRMSLTGSNADYRYTIKPSEINIKVAQLYNEILKLKSKNSYNIGKSSDRIKKIATLLFNNKGKSMVLAGNNHLSTQIIINAINYELGNYNSTIDTSKLLLNKKAIDTDIAKLIKLMNSGSVKGLICYEANPVFDYCDGETFRNSISKVPFTVGIGDTPNETSSLMNYITPSNHYLESWNDVEAKQDYFSFMQPTIQALYDTRQFQSSLLKWINKDTDFHKYIQSYWKVNMYTLQDEYSNFESFWSHTLQKGVFEPKKHPIKHLPLLPIKINNLLENTNEKSNKIELQTYESSCIGNGSMANNPWLQEMPDPVSKICWDNYLNISPKQAKELNMTNGNVVRINSELELPIYILPGQAYNTVSVATGYGRNICGKVGELVGKRVVQMQSLQSGFINNIEHVSLTKIDKQHSFAMTQTHNSMEGRAIVREANLDEYKKDQSAGNHKNHQYDNASIYKEPQFPNHHWGLVIDLNACVGCGACSIACQIENNVPVVGKKEVERAHEMSWLRIDRYFTGNENNPEVVFQPLMCQHCNNAPCENVCPVAATNHSSEGLNQMIYNRCIGTRYCSNNCPYKVRRFNWFDYTNADSIPNNLHDIADMTLDLKRMVLNPDVTIRAKGVIEKCSLCVQRIQEGKLKAKLEGREVKDGDIKMACQQTCPAGAMIFGDLNDKNSKVSKLAKTQRNYHLLEELHTLPSISYLTKIRNKKS